MNIENHMTLMYKNSFNRTTALCGKMGKSTNERSMMEEKS